jgi:hypothetical protein
MGYPLSTLSTKNKFMWTAEQNESFESFARGNNITQDNEKTADLTGLHRLLGLHEYLKMRTNRGALIKDIVEPKVRSKLTRVRKALEAKESGQVVGEDDEEEDDDMVGFHERASSLPLPQPSMRITRSRSRASTVGPADSGVTADRASSAVVINNHAYGHGGPDPSGVHSGLQLPVPPPTSSEGQTVRFDVTITMDVDDAPTTITRCVPLPYFAMRLRSGECNPRPYERQDKPIDTHTHSADRIRESAAIARSKRANEELQQAKAQQQRVWTTHAEERAILLE